VVGFHSREVRKTALLRLDTALGPASLKLDKLPDLGATGSSSNPVAGCSIVSAGCTNCYAMKMASRLEGIGVGKYTGLTRRSGRRTIWNGVVRECPEALGIPFGWKNPRKIFVNSMSDLFHDAVGDEFILRVWQVMRETPRHQYQILTKRPERMAAFVRNVAGEIARNVWLGTSVESADVASRIAHLRELPSAIRFVSFEPLIGPIGAVDLTGIHWAIVGGESGHSARPVRKEWIEEIHAQCRAQGTASFFKQWGAWGEDGERRSKKANGRLYRGRPWDELPAGNSDLDIAGTVDFGDTASDRRSVGSKLLFPPTIVNVEGGRLSDDGAPA
jgi:protein gp37